MNTITSSSSPAYSPVDDPQARLNRSLSDLSARAAAAEADGEPDPTAEASGPSAQIARQNQLSALADSSEALAANTSAVGAIGANPSAALAAQGNLSPEAVLGLL
jgi:hypothetical protein